MPYSKQRETDPLIGYQFALELQGVVTGYFSEVSGIGSESQIVEHKVVDEAGRDFIQKLPGRLKWTDVTLKRGITGSMQIWDWRQLVVDGDMKGARQNCSILMFDRSSEEPAARWDFVAAWPSKVTGPSIKADSNDFAIEELTIVHEGMKRVKA